MTEADPLWLGRDLVQAGTMTAEQFASARQQWRKQPGDGFASVLEQLGLASGAEIAAAIARRYALPLAERGPAQIDRAAVRSIPAELARRKCLVPLRRDNRVLELAVADPGHYGPDEARRDFPSDEVRLRVAPRSEILGLIEESWQVDQAPGAAQERFERVLRQAVAERATDVHLEPRERSLDIRFRIDGRLVHHAFVRDPERAAFVQAAKIAGRLDISDRRLPQDGRGSFATGGRTCHLRYSCIPSVHGESIVIRLLEEAAGARPLSELSLSAANRALLDSLLRLPHGLVYVTGPTGAGKTTLLHSLLSGLPQRDLNAAKIVTLEEPVELRQPRYFLQLEVDERIGRGFAELLRHVLRHDPDVLLVGETRDRATADITLRAALAGRLCFSTLHTNTAWGAVARLAEMGLDPLLLAAALKGVIAQRLVRRPCPSCSRPHPRSEEWRRRFAALLCGKTAEFVAANEGSNCPHCRGRGHFGRTAILEVYPLAGLEGLVSARASLEDFLPEARRLGCRTLFEDGIAKAASGLATVEDVCAAVEEGAKSSAG
jgi:type II secretory ATPase GspE/PulE/Tfp pilus assembly ATPase PilB-like protein